MESNDRSTIVICPNCGEDNAENFRFCGMCGTSLEARRPAGVSQSPLAENVSAQAGAPPRVAGPSFLGLDQASAKRGPEATLDEVREKSFSGFGSFLEPEETNTGGRRILVLLALLAALGAAGWWTYSNYLSATAGPTLRKTASSLGVSQPPTTNSASKTDDSSGPAPGPSSPSSQPASTPSTPSPSSSPPVAAVVTSSAPSKSSKASPAAAERAEQKTRPAVASGAEAKPARPWTTAHAGRKPALPAPGTKPVPVDNGDAAFRKGEAYLYGRGVPESCDEAVKYLKAASAKQSAKARSAFGTMYATGHCVPRDLPTSYSWFALALRVDPNNQILEKDLTAVWNQMTPPERQMATKMNQ